MISRIALLTALAATAIALSAPADAHRHRGAPSYRPATDAAAMPAYPILHASYSLSQRVRHRAEWHRIVSRSRRVVLASSEPSHGRRDMGGRSGSCLRFQETRYLWCGCGAADEVGLDNSDGHWNLAANYFELPRAAPGFNMVAVRNGHVAVLKSLISGTIWMAFDPNGGRQRAWMHAIDLRRFAAVVDPRGTRSRERVAARSHHRPHRRVRYARR